MSRSAQDRRPSFDPVVMEGPPSPDSMTSIASLDERQRARYATLYQNLMSSTKSERDEVAQSRAAMRGTTDRDARHQAMEGLRQTIQSLQSQQQVFDDTLNEFLTKEEMRRYADWRDARRKAARGFSRPAD
jgi:hypothetical protein